MSFARSVWRLLVGIKDGLALLFLLLFFTLVFAALAASPNPAQVRDGALLLKLEGAIVEEVSAVDPIAALLSQSLPTREYAARDLVRAIDEAAGDERISAIALDLSTFLGGGQVNVKEVAEALARFRTAGKPITAYAVAYSDDAMTLAAQADEIWVDPMGGVAIRGPGGTMLFYKEALDRFNVNAQVYQVGTFKGAGEPYTNTQMSPEFRENTETYIGQIWDEYRAHIQQARASVDFDAITTGLVDLAQEHDGDMAQVALAAGFADKIGTGDEWGEHVAQLAGEDEWDESPGAFAHTSLDAWLAHTAPEPSSGGCGSDKGQIGVITASGEISDTDVGPGSAGAARITRLLDNALNDDLAALVVRLDTPGGTVTGSEAIRRSILNYKDKDIPVIVSMGNYAASGGYWIATTGDQIFAEPETLTGSIGIILAIPTFEDLLAEYGVNAEQIGVTPLSGQPDILGGFSPETEQLLQLETAAIYDRFLNLVSSSRSVTTQRADELAQGRVWTGGSARQLGLVDQFGNLDNAIAYAAGQAGLEEGEYSPRYLSEPIDPFDAMLAGMAGNAAQPPQALVTISGLFAAQEKQAASRVLADMDRLFSGTGAQALCLECMAAGPVPSGTRSLQETGWLGRMAQLFLR